LNNSWVTGETCSTNFPTTPGAFQQTSAGVCDAFVSKVDSGGNLVSSSYLGGSDFDQGLGIAVDTSCNAFVTGFTCSTDFPHSIGAFQDHLRGGPGSGDCDAFATRIAQWNLTGRAYGLSVAGLGITGDTGNVSTSSSTNKTAFFAGLDAGLVQATLLNGNVITDACAGRSTGEASAAAVILRLPGAPIITAKAVQSQSDTTCAGSVGTMNVASLQVGSAAPSGGGFPANTIIPLGTGNALILNEQIKITGPDKGLLVNAIHLHASGLDAVVASSKSDIGRCPDKCSTTPIKTTLCDPGICVNTMTDPNNCGGCGTVCGTGQFCTAGACM
jgi:hypothetical protein